MKPTFSYYGSKWRVARVYPPPLDGLPIVEPFAGGAGYAHWWDDGRRDVILTDANPLVASLWTWLLKATPAEILDLPLLENSRIPEGLPTGATALIGFFCGYALAAPRTKLMRDDWEKFPIKYWSKTSRARVAANRAAMGERWTFAGVDYRDHANIEATWMIDPPYANRAGRFYPTKLDSYSDLANWSMARKGRVIVCENTGADWMPFQPITMQVGVNKRKRTSEAIWTNERWRLI